MDRSIEWWMDGSIDGSMDRWMDVWIDQMIYKSMDRGLSTATPPLKTRLWLIIKRGDVQLKLQGGGECGGRVLYWLHKPISTWFLLLFTITYVPIVTIDVPISAYWLQSDKEQKRIVVGIFLLLSMTPIPYAANDSSSYNTTPIHSCVCNTIRL